MKHIISFSGGKDSTALIILMIKKKVKIDEIVFCDTGLEFPEIYDHITEVENKLSINIKKIKSDYSFEYWMKKYKKKKGKNIDKLGYSWPDHRVRWCTKKLKTDVIRQYIKKTQSNNKEVIEYHGITYDELSRTFKNNDGRNIKYPLCDMKLTSKDTLKICYENGFNWNGLYNFHKRANCYCCPLQSLKELKHLYIHYPKLWKNIRYLDSGTWRKFRKDYTIKELEEKFDNEII